MLGSVITARDRWLKHGGLILPSNATVNFLPAWQVVLYHSIMWIY
jgi:protein arginine N-methyltransferase 6